MLEHNYVLSKVVQHGTRGEKSKVQHSLEGQQGQQGLEEEEIVKEAGIVKLKNHQENAEKVQRRVKSNPAGVQEAKSRTGKQI